MSDWQICALVAILVAGYMTWRWSCPSEADLVANVWELGERRGSVFLELPKETWGVEVHTESGSFWIYPPCTLRSFDGVLDRSPLWKEPEKK